MRSISNFIDLRPVRLLVAIRFDFNISSLYVLCDFPSTYAFVFKSFPLTEHHQHQCDFVYFNRVKKVFILLFHI